MLNSRNEVLASLNHKQPSKLPIDLGGCPATSIAAITYNKVIKKLGISEGLPHLYDFMQQLAFPGQKIRELFKVDVVDPNQFFLTDDKYWKEFVIPHDGTKCAIPALWDNIFDIVTDENQTVFLKLKDGTILGKMPKSSRVVDQAYWPLAAFEKIPEEIDTNLINKHLWNVPSLISLTQKYMQNGDAIAMEKMKDLHESGQYLIMYAFGGNIFDVNFTIRGMDNFLIDIYKDRQGAKRLVEKVFENNMAGLEKLMSTFAKYIDVLLFYDDLSYQSGLFIPPEIYREMFKPYHKKMWDYVHKNSDCKVCLHCCGSAYALIPDLIEAGMDIINPVQINALNMEPAVLKKEFGKDLVFWGGGCDTKTLTLKSPEIVKEEVKRNIDILFKDGGYVFSSIHNITAEVPPENVIAMFEAASGL